MSPHYIVIALATIATAVAGGWLTQSGMKWYRTIRVPSWTPAGRTIGAVWTVLYAMAAISAMLAFANGGGARPAMLAALFAVNALLNVAWCFLFFMQRQIGSAALESALLALSIVMLIVNVYPLSLLAALLLAPYLVWVLFATGLTYAIFRLNA